MISIIKPASSPSGYVCVSIQSTSWEFHSLISNSSSIQSNSVANTIWWVLWGAGWLPTHNRYRWDNFKIRFRWNPDCSGVCPLNTIKIDLSYILCNTDLNMDLQVPMQLLVISRLFFYLHTWCFSPSGYVCVSTQLISWAFVILNVVMWLLTHMRGQGSLSYSPCQRRRVW